MNQLQPLQQWQQTIERVVKLARQLIPGVVIELTPGEEVDAAVFVAGQSAIERPQVGVDLFAGLFIGEMAVAALIADRADKLTGQQALKQWAMFDHAVTSC
ncbi:hypothetical protein HSBAA_09810 [Vreelandella sulfidaeris]|uniref:Uncharacterized protein n=1 Tax=Vreelandella sulfidaeris TaxID=115553 RepID=A0A455U1J6_9GAMM|nr:hypothetical protein HSBAA_09810 [Halomonas sulfidaeris]